MKNDEKNDPVSMDDRNAMRDNVKKAKKEGLTKGSLITAVISIIVLAAAGILVYSSYSRERNEQIALMEDQRVSYELQMTTRDSTINSWLMVFDQIEKDLNVIKQKEDIISVRSSDTEFSKERKEQILEDIRLINTLLDNNKKRIAQLSAQLKKSGTEITGLKNMIANLEASILQREEEISGLKLALVEKDFEIGQLNNQMTELHITVTQQTETISSQTEEMNKAYLAFGTYKDLKEKGIVTKEGGFLGLGRREALIDDSPDSLFTRIDITETRMIPVNSKNAKLITSHPTGSYEIIAEGENMIAGIEIKDPNEFWKISRYAVVEIIK